MDEHQTVLFERGISMWEKAGSMSGSQAHPVYETAMGSFLKAIKEGDIDALGYGLIARFCYFYASYHSFDRKDYKEAQKVFSMGDNYANKAIALDPYNFNGRLFKVFSTIDNLGETPNFSSTLLDASKGGFLSRLVKGGFDQGRFATARNNFFVAVAALLDAYTYNCQPESFIEDVILMSRDLVGTVDVTLDYKFDMRDIFETILAVDYMKLKYYSPDEELNNLLETYLELREEVESRLTVQQAREIN